MRPGNEGGAMPLKGDESQSLDPRAIAILLVAYDGLASTSMRRNNVYASQLLIWRANRIQWHAVSPRAEFRQYCAGRFGR
jgi:hypothetical protein